MKLCIPFDLRKSYTAASLSLALLLTSCGGSSIRVESDPIGSEVYVIGANQTRNLVGKTPLELNSQQNPEVFSQGSKIQITKENFQSESFVIPQSAMSTRLTLQSKLKEDPKTTSNGDLALEEAVGSVAQIQRLIYRKEYNQAEKILVNYTAKFPGVATFQSLLGNVYYLQKDLSRALSSYQQANKIQPQNAETNRMIQKINQIRGTSNERSAN